MKSKTLVPDINALEWGSVCEGCVRFSEGVGRWGFTRGRGKTWRGRGHGHTVDGARLSDSRGGAGGERGVTVSDIGIDRTQHRACLFLRVPRHHLVAWPDPCLRANALGCQCCARAFVCVCVCVCARARAIARSFAF